MLDLDVMEHRTNDLLNQNIIIPEIKDQKERIERAKSIGLDDQQVEQSIYKMRCEQAESIGFIPFNTGVYITALMGQPYTHEETDAEKIQNCSMFVHHTGEEETRWASSPRYCICYKPRQSILPFHRKKKQEIWRFYVGELKHIDKHIPDDIIKKILRVKNLKFFNNYRGIYQVGEKVHQQVIVVARITTFDKMSNGRYTGGSMSQNYFLAKF